MGEENSKNQNEVSQVQQEPKQNRIAKLEAQIADLAARVEKLEGKGKDAPVNMMPRMMPLDPLPVAGQEIKTPVMTGDEQRQTRFIKVP